MRQLSRLAWQQCDLARWSSSAATSTPTSSIPEPSSRLEPSSVSSTGSSSCGLSTGAKASIGIGSALAGIAVTASLVCFIWLRRRKARSSHQTSAPSPDSAELPGKSKRHCELSATRVLHEITGGGASGKTEKSQQIAERPEPAELESGWAGWEAPAAAGTQSSNIQQNHCSEEEPEALQAHRYHPQCLLLSARCLSKHESCLPVWLCCSALVPARREPRWKDLLISCLAYFWMLKCGICLGKNRLIRVG